MKFTDDELAQHLKNLEAEQNRLNGALNDVYKLKVKIHQLKTTLTHSKANSTPLVLTNKDKTSHEEKQDSLSTPKSSSEGYGYVVCLMFNPHSPPEWSGNQWHIHGKGKCFSSAEQAYQCLQKLKERWPDYPLQVLKRRLSPIEHVE